MSYSKNTITEIQSFVVSVIENKKLAFTTDEITFSDLLLKDEILKIENNSYSISDYRTISSYFLNTYKEKFEFEITDDFQESVNFLNKITADFLSNGHIRLFFKIEKELWKIIIYESNLKFKCNFFAYLNSLNKEANSGEIFSFIEAYSEELVNLKLPETAFYDSALLILDFTKSDAEYNIPLVRFLNSVKEKCKKYYDFGLTLLDKSFEIEESKEYFLSAIISGLYEHSKVEFFNSILKNKIRDGIKLNAIFFGLSNVDEIDDVDCDLFISLFTTYESDDSLTLSLLSLLTTILKSKNTSHDIYCFQKLKFFLKNENLAYFILNQIKSIDDFDDERIDVVVELINQDYFTIEKYVYPISRLFFDIKDFELLKKITLTLIENKPFESFAKNFISYFQRTNQVELEQFIIKLLTSNQASKRFTGLNIIDELKTFSAFTFSIDILSLSPLIQYKLWVSLTEGYSQPKFRLPAILPLLESENEFVRESLLFKLEEMSEDYGGHITKILEDNLAEDNPNSEKIIKKIKDYIEGFYSSNIDIKKSLTELNPYNTHYILIKKFNEFHSKTMSQSINKGAMENSLLMQLGASTVELSKGGGWRIGSNNDISPLGKFETSFTLPRSYFINPNRYEFELGFQVRQDWSDEEFINIKTFLENE